MSARMSVGRFFVLRRNKLPLALWCLLMALVWVLGVVVHQYILLTAQAPSPPLSPYITTVSSTTSHFNPNSRLEVASEPQLDTNFLSPPRSNRGRRRNAKTIDLVKLEQSKQQQAPIDRSHYDDYTFNGISVTFHNGNGIPASQVRCIHDKGLLGDADEHAWKMRSCMYHNLCLNVETHEYVIFVDADEDEQMTIVNDTRLALGAINPRWTHRGFQMGVWKVQWAPTIMRTTQKDFPGYYALPNHTILIPFHSLAAHNIGHLLWDDFYPMFSLLRTFGLLPTNSQTNYSLLPLRHKITETLYANCDIQRRKRQQCAHNFDRFLSLLGVDPVHFSTTQQAVLQLPTTNRPSPYVCATRGVAGLGMLQDHGWYDHGWNGQGHRPHNLARSSNFQAFGEFLVQHVLPPSEIQAFNTMSLSLVQVVVSTLSSRDDARRLDFALQVQYLRRALDEGTIQVDAYSMWEYSLADQVRLARQAHIWITTCGGGVMTATFLRPASTLIVFYNPEGGFAFAPQKPQFTGEPARLDWDLLNNAGHLRVHWLPITTMDTPDDLELLTRLVRFEAETIKISNDP